MVNRVKTWIVKVREGLWPKLNPIHAVVTAISGASIGFFAWSFTVSRTTFHSCA